MDIKFPWRKPRSVTERLRAVQQAPPLPVIAPGPVLADPKEPALIVSNEPEATPAVIADDAIQVERERALCDPLFLANSVLGFQLQPEHAILLEALLDENFTDVLVMWPRASGKSSSIAVAIVMNLLRNRNYTVRYLTSDIDVAKLRLSQIANCFDQPTEKFRALFPELVGLANRRADEIIVKGRTDAAITDASLAVNTLRSLNTGSHANLIVLDDVVTSQDAESADYRDNNFLRYQHIQGVRTRRLILSGTPYCSDDALGRVQRAIDMEGASTRWRKEVRVIWQHRCTNCTHKSIFHDNDTHVCRLCEKAGHSCPQFQPGEKCPLIDRVETPSGKFGWTVEDILALKSPTRMDARVFATQMELNAAPEAGLILPVFTTEFLDAHTNQTSGLGNLSAKFLVLDVALRPVADSGSAIFAGSDDPDASVMFAVTTAFGPAIPIGCDAGQWDVDTLARHIYEFMRKHPNAPLYTENIDSWPAIRSLIEKRAGAIKLDFRTFAAAREPNAKLHRIARLYTAMATNRVALYYAMPGNPLLRQQLRGKNYRANGHDDFADTMAMIPLVLDDAIAPVTTPTLGFSQFAEPQADFKPSWTDLTARVRWNHRHGFTDTGDDSDGGSDPSAGGLCTG